MVIWTLQKSGPSFTAGNPEIRLPTAATTYADLGFSIQPEMWLPDYLGLEAASQAKLSACSKPSTFARHKVRLEQMESWIRLLSFHPAPSRAAPLPPLQTGYCFGHKQLRCTFGPTQDSYFHGVFASRLQYVPTYFKHSSTVSAKIHW